MFALLTTEHNLVTLSVLADNAKNPYFDPCQEQAFFKDLTFIKGLYDLPFVNLLFCYWQFQS